MIEVNGPANTISLIDVYRVQKGMEIDPQVSDLLSKIVKQSRLTMKYMGHLSNPTEIYWHEVIKGEQ